MSAVPAAVVTSLLTSRSPSDVAGLVRAVVVDPIYRMLGAGTWAYMHEKSLEPFRPTPLFAYPNAPVSIARAAPTPIMHGRPGSVLRRFAESMASEAPPGDFILQAAARAAISYLQITSVDDMFVPAGTSDKPVPSEPTAYPPVSGVGDDDESTEAHPDLDTRCSASRHGQGLYHKRHPARALQNDVPFE